MPLNHLRLASQRNLLRGLGCLVLKISRIRANRDNSHLVGFLEVAEGCSVSRTIHSRIKPASLSKVADVSDHVFRR